MITTKNAMNFGYLYFVSLWIYIIKFEKILIIIKLAVQTYRSKAFKKRRHDLPVGEEYDKWKAQLPNW